jgi:hypothetical protein
MADDERGLVARLSDGSDHILDTGSIGPEKLMKQIAEELRGGVAWTRTQDGGRIRTDAIIALKPEAPPAPARTRQRRPRATTKR